MIYIPNVLLAVFLVNFYVPGINLFEVLIASLAGIHLTLSVFKTGKIKNYIIFSFGLIFVVIVWKIGISVGPSFELLVRATAMPIIVMYFYDQIRRFEIDALRYLQKIYLLLIFSVILEASFRYFGNNNSAQWYMFLQSAHMLPEIDQNNLFSWTSRGYFRGLFPIHHALAYCICLCSLAIFEISRRQFSEKLLIYGVPAAFILSLTNSRAVIIAFIAYLFLRGNLVLRFLFVLGLCLIFIQDIYGFVQNLMEHVIQDDFYYSSLVSRIIYDIRALELLPENMFGVAVYDPKYTNPHNSFVYLLHTLGIVGPIILFVVLHFVVKQLASNSLRAYIRILAFFIIISIAMFPLTDIRVMLPFCIFLSYKLFYNQLNKRDTTCHPMKNLQPD